MFKIGKLENVKDENIDIKLVTQEQVAVDVCYFSIFLDILRYFDNYIISKFKASFKCNHKYFTFNYIVLFIAFYVKNKKFC